MILDWFQEVAQDAHYTNPIFTILDGDEEDEEGGELEYEGVDFAAVENNA